MKTIIIGGVAAGMSAAAKLRRLDREATIHVYEKGMDLSYGGCGMPYYLGDVITDIDRLVARTKDDFERENIQVFVHHEVIEVIPDRKTIRAINKTTNETVSDTYDKLVIATGTKAIRTNVPGSDIVKVYVLNQLSDARELKYALEDVQSVCIVGGGYIGVEVAENLAHRGLKVVLIEQMPQLLPTFDLDVAKKAEEALKEVGVQVLVNERVKYYELNGLSTKVLTENLEVDVDLVIESIGVKPNTEFLQNTGLNMLRNGAIVVNDYMETSIKDIYAAGDCAAYYHLLKKENVFLPLGTHANKSGKIVAENIAGNPTSFAGVIGSNVLKVVNLTFAKTGIGMDEARKLDLGYEFVDVTSKNQSGYYPGAKEIFIRVVYEPLTGILRGAQMVGEKGVSDRINIIALAITQGLTAKEFSQLDLAYSPPFSTVWDPLQVATNQIKID
ncbi:MAG: CoA-disulfide reductase [Firmicutes bacterium]|nr:CoA-disulfide reductase [Bacillota bacterium]